jgi:proteasome lid subunit RPN8/RPN11
MDDDILRNRALRAFGSGSTFRGVHVAKMRISRQAFREIMATVGTRRPEAGGLLVGPIGADGISRFHFDKNGSTSSATYSPSHVELTQECEKSAKKGHELKGFCHSHPGGIPSPSAGDLAYVREFFRENPGLMKFYMPILFGTPVPEEFARKNGSGRTDWYAVMRCFVITRENMEHPEEIFLEFCDEADLPEIETCREVAPQGVEAGPDISTLQRELPQLEITRSSVNVDNRTIACLVACNSRVEVLLFLPSEFPVLGPSVLITRKGEGTRQVDARWKIESDLPLAARLIALITNVIERSS